MHAIPEGVLVMVAIDVVLADDQRLVGDILLSHLLEGADIPDWGAQILAACTG